jgi:hypothetical protein
MATMRIPAGDATALAAMEAHLSLLMSGEGGRCAFLRSHSYLQFRMGALYRTRTTGDPVVIWTPSGVRLEYTPDPDGGYISLCSQPALSDASD